MPFKIRLTDEQKEDYLRKIEDDIAEDVADRASHDLRRKKHYNAYRNRTKRKTDPWDGCSNVSIPLGTRAVDRTVIQVNETIAPRGSFSTITAVPITDKIVDEVMDKSKSIGNYIGYYFRNRMNLMEEWERFSRSVCAFGNGFAKVFFDRKERNVRKIERFPAVTVVQDPESGEEVVQNVSPGEMMDRMFSLREQMKDAKDMKAPKGHTKRMYFLRNPDTKKMEEITVEGYVDEDTDEILLQIDQRVAVCNTPRFEYIDMDNIFFSMDARRIEDVSRIQVRHYKSYSDIVAGFRTGRWNQLEEDDLDDLKAHAHMVDRGSVREEDLVPRTTLDTHGPGLKDRQDEVEGQTTRVQPLEVWECFRREDIDDDGEDEEVVFWIELSSRKVLRAEYLSVEYLTNERPIIHASLIPVADRLLGIGLIEVLMPLIVELNTLVNNRNDANSLKLNPGGFYRPGSGFYPSKVAWKPGTWLQIDQPQADVAPYQPFNDTRDSIDLERFFFSMAEDLTISSQSFGRSGDRSGTTARGTLAMLQQDAIKLDYVMKRLLPALEKLCHMTLALLRQHGPEQEEFRVTGSQQMQTISKEDLEQKYDFFFDIDTVSANREIRRQFVSAAFQATLPILMQPAVPPGAAKMARKLLEVMEIQDVDDIIPEPPGFERAPMSQMDEISLMLQGVSVDPVLADNHQEHIMIMDEFEQTGFPQYTQITPQWVEAIWKPHKIKHMQMLQEIQRQQSALGGGMNGNSGIGPGVQQGPFGGVEATPGLGGATEISQEAPGAAFLGG